MKLTSNQFLNWSLITNQFKLISLSVSRFMEPIFSSSSPQFVPKAKEML